MDRVVTLGERKATERSRRLAAVAVLRQELAAYGLSHGGRFVLFGSAARETMRHDSDVDILVDFPPDALDDAWVFAEDACWRLKLSPDILPRSWCRRRFLDHTAADAVSLP